MTADARAAWESRLAAGALGSQALVHFAADFAAGVGHSPLREPVLAMRILSRVRSDDPRLFPPETLALLDRSPSDSPFLWLLFAQRATADGAPVRGAVYAHRALTWLLAEGPRGARAAIVPGLAEEWAHADRDVEGSEWTLLVRSILPELAGTAPEAPGVSAAAAAASGGTEGPSSPVLGAATDGELGAGLRRIERMLRELADRAASGEGGTGEDDLRRTVTEFRELLHSTENRRGQIEWGTCEERGPARIASDIAEAARRAAAPGDDGSVRPTLAALAGLLRGQEKAQAADAGYWEARAAVHRAAGDAEAEERALVAALARRYRRPGGALPEPQRRPPLLDRLIGLVRERARSPDSRAVEPLTGSWPPAGTHAELWARRALLLAVWSLAVPAAPGAERHERSKGQLAETAAACGEPGAVPGLLRWGEDAGR
jgi:hypothetical protein